MEQGKNNTILAIVPLIFILGGIGTFIYAGINEIYWLLITALGVTFLSVAVTMMIGLLSEKKKKHLTLPVIFVIIGAAVAVIGILLGFGPSEFEEFLLTYAPSLVAAAVALIGVIFIISSFAKYKSHIKYCNEEVTATCIDLLEKIDEEGDSMLCPVWEFYHNGETKQINKNVFIKAPKNSNFPEIGDKRVLMVDAENLDDYYEGNPFDIACKVFLWVGIGLTVAGIMGAVVLTIVLGK